MLQNNPYVVTQDELDAIKDEYEETTVPNFLKKKVATNADKMSKDSSLAPILNTEIGMEAPGDDVIKITATTTYKDVFLAKYDQMKPNFP